MFRMSLVSRNEKVQQNKKTRKPVTDIYFKAFCCCSLLCLSVSASLLTEFSKNSEGIYPYNSLTIVPIVELLKIIISVFLLFLSPLPNGSCTVTFQRFMMYSIPAVCYFVSNNCLFFIVSDLGATQFQILGNLKIIFNALFLRYFLKRRFKLHQWKGLTLLTLGVSLTQLETISGAGSQEIRGYTVALLSCIASSFGGVYCEKLLKDDFNAVIHVANIQLYCWGCVFGILLLLISDRRFEFAYFFEGYSLVVICVILTLALTGICVSYVVKHLDNIVKSFVTSFGIFATAIIRIQRGTEHLRHSFVIGLCVMTLSLGIYHKK